MLLFLAGLGLALAVLGIVSAAQQEAGEELALAEAASPPEMWEKTVPWL